MIRAEQTIYICQAVIQAGGHPQPLKNALKIQILLYKLYQNEMGGTHYIKCILIYKKSKLHII